MLGKNHGKKDIRETDLVISKPDALGTCCLQGNAFLNLFKITDFQTGTKCSLTFIKMLHSFSRDYDCKGKVKTFII